MKKNKFLSVYLFLIALFGLLISSSAISGTKSKGGGFQKSSVTFETELSKISNHEFYITNYGLYGQSVSGGAAGWYWPRQSNKAYIYGASIWFGTKKKIDIGGEDSLVKVVTVGYNPNSGAAWFTPGSVDDGPKGLDDGDPRSSKYVFYRSVDYDATGKNVISPSRPDWPIRWKDASKQPGKDGYFGEYISDPAERASYKPVYISQEDMFCIYKDTDIGRNPEYKAGSGYPNGIDVQQTVYSWGFGPYKDFVFFVYNVINKSGDTLRDCYLAPAMDPDIGNAANDHNAYYKKGQDSLLNLAYQYTEDEGGYNGVLGFDFLESPKIKTAADSAYYRLITGRTRAVGEQLGLTTFRNWTIDIDPSGANARYDFMAANRRDIDNGPGDKRLLFATGPFTMLPGDTARTVMCIMIAPGIGSGKSGVEDTPFLDSLLALDKFAQGVYDNNFSAPKPPDAAKVSGYGIDRGVVVQWDASSETSIDTLTEGPDFYGYRVYRSRGPQGPWKLLYDVNLSKYVKEIGGKVIIDTSAAVGEVIPHKFIDVGADTAAGLLNNLDYYYWVSSYDYGDKATNVLPLENTPVATLNVVKITPVGPTAGHNISYGNFKSSTNLGSLRNWRVVPTNQARFSQLFSGHPLKVTLNPVNDALTYSIDVNVKDTVGGFEADYRMEGRSTFVFIVKPTPGVVPQDSLINNLFTSPELFNCFKILVDYSIYQYKDSLRYDTAMVTAGNSNVSAVKVPGDPPLSDQNFGDANITVDFLVGGSDTLDLGGGDKVVVPYLNLRFTNATTGEVFTPSNDGAKRANYGKWWLNGLFIKSKNGNRAAAGSTRNNINKYYLTTKFGASDTVLFAHKISAIGYSIALDPNNWGRLTGFAPNRQWQVVPVATKDFSVCDQITLSFKGGISGTLGASALPSKGAFWNANASNQKPSKYTPDLLKQVKVVPNPYFVSHKAQITTDVPRLFFNNLPPTCMIRIYNVAGDLIKTINHTNGTSKDEWDLLSEGRQKIASQLLLAHIETPDGATQIVKFSVIVGGFRSIRE